MIGLLKPQAVVTSMTGAAVAINLFEDDAVAVLQSGAFVSTPTLDVTIEASTSVSTGYVTAGTFTTSTLTSGGEAAIGVNLAGMNYVRAKIVLTNGGTTQSVPIAVSLFGGLDYQASTINSAAIA